MIKKLISIIIWLENRSSSSDFSLTSKLYQSIITMDSDDTTYDIVHNLMHQTNDKIRIGENAKVTQHDPEF